MLDRIVRTSERYRMLAPGMRLGVAVSGGADSVCLLHVLLELAASWNLRLTVLHLNHRLRVAESDGDAEFVRELANRLDLPVAIAEADVGAAPGNLEQAARAARLSFYRETIESGRVERVAVGHTASDQAETVLYRFLRGAGTAGLAAIRPVTSDGVIRPLIGVERNEVEAYLRQRGIPWRQDSTNLSPRFARNRIRHELLPRLAREWNPAIGRSLGHLADWALAEEDYWAAEIDRLADRHIVESQGRVLIRADAFAGLPLAVARRLVRRAIERAKGDLRGVDFSHVNSVLEVAARRVGSGGCQVPGVVVRRSLDWVCLAKSGESRSVATRVSLPVTVPGIVPWPGGSSAISMELIEKKETSAGAAFVYNEEIGWLDWCVLSGPLELRNWRPGDQYQPMGSAGVRKIKTLFQEARIPSWERRLWPILTDGVSILWTRRFGAAARFAAKADSQVVLAVREVQLSEIGIGSGGAASK